MRKKFSMLFALLLALVLLSTGCVPKYTAPEETNVPVVTPEPLAAQEEIQDDGQPFAYKVSGTITDNMVIQRDQYVNIFGFSDKTGGVIYADFMGQTRYATVDENGEWLIQFDAQPASTEPTTLKVYNKSEGPDGGKTFSNILIGDVWIIAGQSNVQVSLAGTLDNNPDFVSTISDKDNIRLFTQYYWDYFTFFGYSNKNEETGLSLTIEADKSIQKDIPDYSDASWLADWLAIEGKSEYTRNAWTQATVETAKEFSAVGYYFAKQVADNTDVPIGMIMMTAGGAAICDFMPPQYIDDTKHNHGLSLFEATDIWNSLMAPFQNTKVAGFLWYQGESNEGYYDLYTEDLVDFVGMMRKIWGENMPFYSVQITSHNDTNGTWPNIANLRFAQAASLGLIDNYYLICSMDYGSNALDTDWAHPKNKKHVGDRLAYIALSKIYQPEKYTLENYGSPAVAKVEVKDGYAYVYYKYVGDGLKTCDGSKEVIGFYSKDALSDLKAEIVSKNCVKVILEDRLGNSITGKDFTLVYGNNAMADQSSCNLQNSNGIGALAFSYKYKVE